MHVVYKQDQGSFRSLYNGVFEEVGQQEAEGEVTQVGQRKIP